MRHRIDAQRTGFQQLSVNLILLDRSLKFYGPETKQIRETLQHTVALVVDRHWPRDGSKAVALDAPDISESAGALIVAIRELTPQTDGQKSIQSQALQISADLARTRWNLSHADESAIPLPFLIVLIFWLTVLFVTFGLFSPWNLTVVTVLLVCALSLAAAIFLIVEMDRPFHGLIQVSGKPLRDALSQLDR